MYIPPPPSPEAQELGGHLTDVIEAYPADHPHMSPLDVRQAVRLAQNAVPGGNKLTIKAVVIGVVVLIVVAYLVLLRAAAPG